MSTTAREDGPLVVERLVAAYGARPVLDGVSLAPVAPGTVMSLVGPNAAGKTTLLRALAGLHPATGSIRLGTRELTALPLAEHARLVTYMPQSLPQKVALSVLEGVVSALRVGAAGAGGADLVARAVAVLDQVGIGHLAMRGLDQLSGGQRQLASLAQAIARVPRVLLLDEPISALDLHYQLRVMKLVRHLARHEGMAVVMVLHDLAMAARWSDRVAVLSEGRVVADGVPADAITADVLATVYRVAAEVTGPADRLHLVLNDTL